jgi:hypothetical protein
MSRLKVSRSRDTKDRYTVRVCREVLEVRDGIDSTLESIDIKDTGVEDKSLIKFINSGG